MRILLVEDHPRVASAVTNALRTQGHTVTLASTLTDARVELRRERLELCVVDVALPDGSGLDFCREVRAEDDSVPCGPMFSFETGTASVSHGIFGAREFATGKKKNLSDGVRPSIPPVEVAHVAELADALDSGSSE